MAAFIAQGIAPLQLENPLNQMGKIYQIQQAQQENELARMKMQEYQRGAEEENRLRELYARPDVDIRSPEFLRQVYAVSPTRGAAMQKSAFEAQKAQRESDEAAEKLVSQRIANARGLLPSITPATWGAWRADTIAKLPGLANMIPEQYSDEARLQLMQTADQYLASRKPQVVGPDSSVYDPATGRFTQGPGRSQLLTPEEEAQKIRIAAAGRTPAQPREPAAPTITQIQDPTNPLQMITVDARRYQGGGVGSPGVIGSSGKTVKAEADALKKEQAQSDASAILDTLKVAYTNLDRMRAIPSEQRGSLSNIASGIAATGVGQMAGRMTGTEAQTQRDIIASARNQLFAAVKNATGLSAQNLNSNVEFTTWLNSLTDPSRSIQANQTILDNMEAFIATGGKYTAKKGGGASGSAPAPGADVATERANAQAAIAAGASAEAVRKRFKEKTGQEL